MKKIVLFMIMTLTLLAGHIQAQDTEKKLSREEKKALQEQLDSLFAVEAIQAINEKAFTLEADQLYLNTAIWLTLIRIRILFP